MPCPSPDDFTHAEPAVAVPFEFIVDDDSYPDERIPYALSPLIGFASIDHPTKLTEREALQLVGAP